MEKRGKHRKSRIKPKKKGKQKVDQIQQREKAILKLRKIKVLAEQGVGGERAGANKIYEDLKRKYQITEAEIEKTLPEPKKRKEMSLALAFLQQQLYEENVLCSRCKKENGVTEDCKECGTRGNIEDLQRQYEQIIAELEGRPYAEP